MMYLRLEFFKCRRRKIVPVCAALLGAQLIWFVIYLLRQDAQALSQGWMLLLYNLALDDAYYASINGGRHCQPQL